MTPAVVRAGAKLNLALDITGKRPDGFHDLAMVMHTVTLYDTLTIGAAAGGRHVLRAPNARVPTDRRNIALAAAELYMTRTGRQDTKLDILLEKRIPVCAGLGGGSADAAAVLRHLWNTLDPQLPRETMLNWALELGSDVPYCLVGGTTLATGRGEILEPLPPLPPCHVLLCKPPVSVSTRQAFAMVDRLRLRRRPDIPRLRGALEQGDLAQTARTMFNVFEEPISAEHRVVGRIRSILIDGGALGAVMSGTGPTVFGLFALENLAQAKETHRRLRSEFRDTFLVGSEESMQRP